MATTLMASSRPPDRRGSWIPTGAMISTRFMELRKRRGLMIALVSVNIGLPTVFLLVRMISHWVAPKTYGPAGGYGIFSSLVVGVLFVFGFIVAATVGASAGSADLSEGMFRHLVVTGRSRLAIYFARIPAGLAIVFAMVAAGFTIVCLVCCFAAPTRFTYEGVSVPQGLSRSGLEQWAESHVSEVVCDFHNGVIGVGCGPHGLMEKNGTVEIIKRGPSGPIIVKVPIAQLRGIAQQAADYNYVAYSKQFLTPPISLMVRTGLWIELEAAVGFVVGLGLSSLIGQRTLTIVLLVVLEVILTPILIGHVIAHVINAERAIVGVAMTHLEPHALTTVFGGGPSGQRGVSFVLPESVSWSWVVVVSWLVGWTALGAWRMATRDA